jgi:hypothetical protein
MAVLNGPMERVIHFLALIADLVERRAIALLPKNQRCWRFTQVIPIPVRALSTLTEEMGIDQVAIRFDPLALHVKGVIS